MIKQFNMISGWVSSALVTQVTLDGRVEVLKKFIDLMEDLHELNNLNGMMEILSGINNSSVRRMKQTFGALDSDSKKKYDFFFSLLNNLFLSLMNTPFFFLSLKIFPLFFHILFYFNIY